MRFIDEYRDPTLARKLVSGIERLAAEIARPVTVMEVCGSHTFAIGRFGLRRILPESLRLLSGPGCPVCVTSIHDVDVALNLAGRPDTVFVTFGDMMRVPGMGGESLQKARARGADVRVVSSALEGIRLAEEEKKGREIVFMGIGFETTSPTIAAMVKACRKSGISNVSVFSVHKVIPPAIAALLADPALAIDGFLCPGHVSTIVGAEAYRAIPEAGRAAVITGFEPVDILEGIYMILGQIREDSHEVEIQYRRVVKAEGNPKARAILSEVFRPAPAMWRGLGEIPGSGLVFREEFAGFDALARFDVPAIASREPQGCRCGDILRGLSAPHECPLFGSACTPSSPVGACMVSSEGTCAAHFRYRK